jgi:nicotinate-nucleotide adenylyltransferase
MRIALYGLSADPPHRAHALAMVYLSQVFDEVWTWAVDNPLKQQVGCTLDHRQQMVALTVASLQTHSIKHCPAFARIWTAESVAIIRHLYPEAELWIALGSDALQQVDQWALAELLQLRATGFVEVVRAGSPSGLAQMLGLPVQVLTESIPAYASQDMRSSLRAGIHPDGLLPEVFAYIQQQHLYQDS